jgi:predicted GNAT family acetyltransferase
MANIQTFPKFQDFLDFNKRELLDNYFIYYHFHNIIKELNAKNLDLYEAYNVSDDNANSVICLKATGNLLIYSNNWTDDIIDTLAAKINLQLYKNFSFLGQTDLIIELFKKSKIDYTVFKDRLIYTCTETKPLKKEVSGRVENATFNDFDELVEMSMDFYVEEYDGKGQQTIEDMQASVFKGIETSNLFLLRDEGQICSIVQVISTARDNPMIGNLFTKSDKRNRGYGYKLLHTVTEGLLKDNFDKIGLVSDITNPASNKIFVDIGYKSIYNWATVLKEELQPT